MKKLALFDIDGVVYKGHAFFDLVQNQEKEGIIPVGTWQKILSDLEKYKTGDKTYKEAADSMLKNYALAIKGLSYSTIFDNNLNYFKANNASFFDYFEKLMAKLKISHDLFFVTTNFQFTTKAVGRVFKIDRFLCSIAEVKDGEFTGKVGLSLGGNKGLVGDLVDKYGKNGSIAVGDSENDADMLDKVEHPFVMEPNSKLQVIAKEKGWQIVNRDNIIDIITSHV